MSNSKISFEKNEKILIAPYSRMATSLKEYLENSFTVNILGFIDKNKKEDGIFSLDEVSNIKYDKIIIISPNHYTSIYKEHLKYGISKKNIALFSFKDGFFKSSLFKLNINRKIESIYPSILFFLQKKYKFFFEKKNHILLLAPDFIDINIKDLYIYLSKQNTCTPIIASNNKEQIKLFKEAGFNIVLYPSFKFIYHSLKASIKILDHNPFSKIECNSLLNSKVVQLWHGIPLKKIGHLVNYKKIQYDLLISTSDFVSEYSFSKIFSYKKLINSGYPRNDILVNKNIDKKSLVLVNNELYEHIKETTLHVLIYMPTWRENGLNTNPIDLDDFNSFAKENNLFIVFKMHPFIRMHSFFSSLNEQNYKYEKEYSKNIVFYPSTDDIYPILPLSELLITDYSSIYFDYLLLNKPIIFFVYDKEEYLESQGDFMLDFEKNTPGLKSESYTSLKSNILYSLKQDKYFKERLNLKSLLFENHIGTSSDIIYEEIKLI